MAGNETIPSITDKYSMLGFAIRFYPEFVTFDRMCTPVWYILGLFGNTLSAFIWMQPSVRKGNSSAIYLIALSIWDLVFLICHSIFIELPQAWDIKTNSMPVLCELHGVFAYTAQYISPLLVLAFSVERWISVCFPFKKETLCTPKRAKIMVCLLSFGCLLWNFPQAYLMTYNNGNCGVRNHDLWLYYSMITELFLTGVTPVSALIFNLLVIQELYKITLNTQAQMDLKNEETRQQNHRMERRARSTTIMLLTVSFYVILTTLPTGVMYVLQGLVGTGNERMTDEQILQDPTWTKYFLFIKMKKIIDELTLSHYSLNFIIYIITGDQYRSQVKSIFCSSTPVACFVSRSAKRKHDMRQKERFFMQNSCTYRQSRIRRQETNSTTQTDNVTMIENLNGADIGHHEGPVKPLLATYI